MTVIRRPRSAFGIRPDPNEGDGVGGGDEVQVCGLSADLGEKRADPLLGRAPGLGSYFAEPHLLTPLFGRGLAG